MRYHFLDDAFINLRHAELLFEKGYITFDGVTRTDGISSLLGVTLWGLFLSLFGSVLVPKYLSVFFYFCFLALLINRLSTPPGPPRHSG